MSLNDFNYSKKDIQKWIDALRSGKYKQGYSELQSDEEHFCCLGVACKAFIPEEKQEFSGFDDTLYGILPNSQPFAPEWLVNIDRDFLLRTGGGAEHPLSYFNDGYKLTFDEIADILQAVYIEEVMKGVTYE